MKSFIIVFFVQTLVLSTLMGQAFSTNLSLNIDETLTFSPIDSSQYSYPWYIVKHSGGFENTFGDTIIAQDTIHIIHNARLFHKDGERRFSQLPFVEAHLKNDTLVTEKK